jgi:hypothetical protein
VLGQKPFDLGEVLVLQVRIAEILESQRWPLPPPRGFGRHAPLLNRHGQTDSARRFFEPLERTGFGLLVHVRRPRSVGKNLSAIRN